MIEFELPPADPSKPPERPFPLGFTTLLDSPSSRWTERNGFRPFPPPAAAASDAATPTSRPDDAAAAADTPLPFRRPELQTPPKPSWRRAVDAIEAVYAQRASGFSIAQQPRPKYAAGALSQRADIPVSDPNIVRVADTDPSPRDDNIQLAQQQSAQQRPASQEPGHTQSLPSETPGPPMAKDVTNYGGRDPSKYFLKFDGRYLKLYNGDEVVREWRGVSGKENFGSARDQDKRNYGPIPEGTYDIKQSRHQTISTTNELLGWIGRGEWAGSVRGWGTERVWAVPTKETVNNGLTFGRKDMAIHGGWTPGSAGCIDLTNQMSDFAKTFRNLGIDLKLYVDYKPPVPENGLISR